MTTIKITTTVSGDISDAQLADMLITFRAEVEHIVDRMDGTIGPDGLTCMVASEVFA